ncbi:uncharacterized protein LOC8279794 [Ricinus communis]|uniref:Protein binding protein, putative n=1 Tax=Ricinus communis TaxID=3988 RepID=B9S385_RICCO|nr:uncharacterized protein LOC8279794 [Ricinus communis]EEF41867.1 protein binding protein, putative [Ricinus communis]|eukprot:XP_002520454.1 uncharacterized protein LOC8279794 [Ricinus communis]
MATLHTTAHFSTDQHHHHHHLSRSSSSSSSDNDMSLSGEIGAHRDSSGSDCLSQIDLEIGVLEDKVHLGSSAGGDNKTERDCRICHLGLESYAQENGVATELGCSCKGDLGAAHKKCAETWFKIKGDTICEICGTTALSVAGKQANEARSVSVAATTAPAAPVIMVEARTFWHSRRVMNFLLACMVFAFVISWLFHFKVLS